MKGPTFKRGNRVYLLRKNLKSKRPSSKLDYICIGLFEIEEERGPINFKLKLLTKASSRLLPSASLQHKLVSFLPSDVFVNSQKDRYALLLSIITYFGAASPLYIYPPATVSIPLPFRLLTRPFPSRTRGGHKMKAPVPTFTWSPG